MVALEADDDGCTISSKNVVQPNLGVCPSGTCKLRRLSGANAKDSTAFPVGCNHLRQYLVCAFGAANASATDCPGLQGGDDQILRKRGLRIVATWQKADEIP